MKTRLFPALLAVVSLSIACSSARAERLEAETVEIGGNVMYDFDTAFGSRLDLGLMGGYYVAYGWLVGGEFQMQDDDYTSLYGLTATVERSFEIGSPDAPTPFIPYVGAGRDLEETGAVRITEEDRGMIRCAVAGQRTCSVTLTRRLVIHCDCDVFLHKGCCRHAVAVWLYADRRKIPESMMKKQAPETASELTSIILRDMPAEANVRLETTIVLPQKAGQELRIGLRTGEKKL